MGANFEVYRDKAEEYRFRLKAQNGQILLSSEGYSSKAGCMNGVDSVKKNAVLEGRFKKSVTKKGSYTFALLARNGQIIGTGPQVAQEEARDEIIGSVMAFASGAEISDDTIL